jgi:hypothetical protein
MGDVKFQASGIYWALWLAAGRMTVAYLLVHWEDWILRGGWKPGIKS